MSMALMLPSHHRINYLLPLSFRSYQITSLGTGDLSSAGESSTGGEKRLFLTCESLPLQGPTQRYMLQGRCGFPKDEGDPPSQRAAEGKHEANRSILLLASCSLMQSWQGVTHFHFLPLTLLTRTHTRPAHAHTYLAWAQARVRAWEEALAAV